MRIADFKYELPETLIAQDPPERRDDARMMVVHRATGQIEHAAIPMLRRYLRGPDVLVTNNTRVIPARLFGRKEPGGGRVEILFLEEIDRGRWRALCKASRRPRPGGRLILADGRVGCTVEAVGEDGEIAIRLDTPQSAVELLETEGTTPLPPYIRRGRGGDDERAKRDRERYQTVYATHPGSVAAPTAGLHFTDERLAELADDGVRHASVTLHVGPGTFRPMIADPIETQTLDGERYRVPAETATAIGVSRDAGGRVIAVGTTTVRTLETVAARGPLGPCEGTTDLFIYPPYDFRIVDGLLTNFHLPQSSLLMLVCAFGGVELVLRAYREAVANEYRFYSFGDCMLLL